VSDVRYELGYYIPEDGVLHNHRRENLKSYITQISSIVNESRDNIITVLRYLSNYCSVE
jgi:hypothetical protein